MPSQDKLSLGVIPGIFLLFLLVRLFSFYPYFEVGGDLATYLTLGRNFPNHSLYNHDLYLIHPPLHGYLIGLVHLFLPLVQSGMFVSLTFAVGFFFLVKAFAEALGLPRCAVWGALLYVATAKIAVIFDASISRVNPQLVFWALTLIWTWHFFSTQRRFYFWLASLSFGFSFWLSDQALFLFPAIGFLWFFRKPQPSYKSLGALFGIGFIFWSAWLFVRFSVFSTQGVYPAGVDGTIEVVKNFQLKHLIQPNFLPATDFYRRFFTSTSFSWTNFSWREFFSVPFLILLIPKYVAQGVGMLLLAGGFVLASSQTRKLWGLLFLLSLLFYFPCLFGMHDWYGIGYLLPFSILVGLCAAQILNRIPERLVGIGVLLTCAGFIFFWFYLPTVSPRPYHHYQPQGGKHFLFSRQVLTRGVQFNAAVLQKLPDAGFMAPVGLTPDLIYISGKRMVSFPFNPQDLLPFAEIFDVAYVIFDGNSKEPGNNAGWSLAKGYETFRFVEKHPHQFEKIAEVQESYPAVYAPDSFMVYKIIGRMASDQK